MEGKRWRIREALCGLERERPSARPHSPLHSPVYHPLCPFHPTAGRSWLAIAYYSTKCRPWCCVSSFPRRCVIILALASQLCVGVCLFASVFGSRFHRDAPFLLFFPRTMRPLLVYLLTIYCDIPFLPLIQYPLIYKTLRVDATFNAKQAVRFIADTVNVTSLLVGTEGLYIPDEKRWLDDDTPLSSYESLQDVVRPLFPLLLP